MGKGTSDISKREKLNIGLKGKTGELEKRSSLRDIAENMIKDLITDQILEPGEIYNETLIANELGISKTPVREALLELSSRGFISVIPRKGFKVNSITERDIVALYDFRILLESEIVSKLAENISDKDLKKLERCHADMILVVKNDDRKHYQAIDRVFHSTLAHIYDNLYITQALEKVWHLIDWMGATGLTQVSRQSTIEEHKRILVAIREHDYEAAKLAIIDHINNTSELVLSHLGSKGVHKVL